MLNFNLQKLCGQACTELRVKDPAQYGWHPRRLVEQLVEIYINLMSSQFAKYIAMDEVSVLARGCCMFLCNGSISSQPYRVYAV
jgi:ubiquitin conjugation factor E4 B